MTGRVPPARGGRGAETERSREDGVVVRTSRLPPPSARHGEFQSNVRRVPTGFAGDMFRMLSRVPGDPAMPHGPRLVGRFLGSERANAIAFRRRCRATTSARFLRSASSVASASATSASFVRFTAARSRTSSSHAAAFAARRSSAMRSRSCQGGLDDWSPPSSHATPSGSSSMRTTGTSVGRAETRVAE